MHLDTAPGARLSPAAARPLANRRFKVIRGIRLHCHTLRLGTAALRAVGVSGAELAEQLLLQKPGLKIIFTSGYTANEVSPEVLAKTRAQFLQKPYSHAALAKIIRDCLDQAPDAPT